MRTFIQFLFTHFHTRLQPKWPLFTLRSLGLGWALSLSLSLSAQSPYHGGPSDGFAMTEKKGIIVQSVQQTEKSSFSFFPNPCKEGADISYTLKDNGMYIISIYSVEGKLLFTVPAEKTGTLSTSGLSKGVYLVELKSSGSVYTRRLVIQ